jgi:hypothetical protein
VGDLGNEGLDHKTKGNAAFKAEYFEISKSRP